MADEARKRGGRTITVAADGFQENSPPWTLEKTVLELAESLFDREYYTSLHADVEESDLEPFEHYCQIGWRQGFDPSPKFSTRAYLDSYPDVREARVNPLLHFIKFGRSEGRKPIAANAVDVGKDQNSRWKDALADHFDAEFYARKYPDAILSAGDLLEHYLAVGWREAKDPNSWFSTAYYLDTYPDVKASGMNPLLHYVYYGRKEGRRCSMDLAESFNLVVDPKSKYPVLRIPVRKTSGNESECAAYPKLAVHLHCYYADMINTMYGWLERLPCRFDLYISISDAGLKARLEEGALANGFCVKKIAVVPNRGRDLAPMLVSFGEDLQKYDLCLHVHTKKSVEKEVFGRAWLRSIEHNLLFNSTYCDGIIRFFQANTKCGIMAPFPYKGIQEYMVWGRNADIASDFLDHIDLSKDILNEAHIDFPAGSMFWFRPQALAPVFGLGLQYSDFPREPVDDDGTLAHAIERCFFHIASQGGFEVFKVLPQDYHHAWPEQMLPRLSVIIPVRNGMPWIWHAIASVLNQEQAHIATEIIIVDNNSTDDTPARLRGLGDIYSSIRIAFEAVQGAGAARNRGLDLARGEYVMFLDADDALLPSAVGDLFEALELSDPHPDLVTSSLVVFDEAAHSGAIPFPITGNVDLLDRGLDQRSRAIWERVLSDFGPCAKIYSRDFLNRNAIRFPTEVNFEDNSFIYDVYLMASSIAVLGKATYLYRKYKAYEGLTQSTDLTADALKAQFDAIDLIVSRHSLGSRKLLLDKLATQALGRKISDEIRRTGLAKDALRMATAYPRLLAALRAYGAIETIPGLKRATFNVEASK